MKYHLPLFVVLVLIELSLLSGQSDLRIDSLKKVYPQFFENMVEEREGTLLPYAEFQMLDGRITSSNYYKGKSTLVFFWSVNCGRCIERFSALNQVKNVMGDDYYFLALSNDSRNDIKAVLYDHPFTFDIGILPKGYSMDLGIKTIPKLLIVDNYGTIQSVLPKEVVKPCADNHPSECAQSIINFINKQRE